MILLIIILCRTILSIPKCYDQFVIKNVNTGNYLTYPGGRIDSSGSYEINFEKKNKNYYHQKFDIYDGELVSCVRRDKHKIGISLDGKFGLISRSSPRRYYRMTYDLRSIYEIAKNISYIPISTFIEYGNAYRHDNVIYSVIYIKPNRKHVEMTFDELQTIPHDLDQVMYEIGIYLNDKYIYFDILMNYPHKIYSMNYYSTTKDIKDNIDNIDEITVDGFVFKRRKYNIIYGKYIDKVRICMSEYHSVLNKYDISTGVDSIPYKQLQRSNYVFSSDIFCTASYYETHAFHWMIRNLGINPQEVVMYMSHYDHIIGRF